MGRQVLKEKEKYEKPVILEQDEMVFPEEVISKITDGHWCFGCSNCNCN